MKSFVATLVAASVALAMTAQTFAVDGEEQVKIKLPPQAQQLLTAVQKLDLNQEQEQHVQKVQQQYAPVFQQHIQAQQEIYTQDQKQSRKQYVQEGKKEGLKGKELNIYVQDKLQLTPEQKTKFTQCETNIAKQQSKFRTEVLQVLTPDQVEALPERVKTGKGKGKGKEGRNKDRPKVQVEPK